MDTVHPETRYHVLVLLSTLFFTETPGVRTRMSLSHRNYSGSEWWRDIDSKGWKLSLDISVDEGPKGTPNFLKPISCTSVSFTTTTTVEDPSPRHNPGLRCL